jgi:hypothetical protein
MQNLDFKKYVKVEEGLFVGRMDSKKREEIKRR